MIQDFLGKLLRCSMGQILAQPFGVKTSLIHANQANSREMIFKGTQIALGIGV